MGKSVAFITCVNDEREYNECLKYIDSLIIPEGFEKEIIAIRDAKSMTSGYNRAMRQSKSKYKVYLHQDVMIVNKNFIQDMLDVFQDETVGMFGCIGSKKIPTNGIWWDAAEQYGKVYESSTSIMKLLQKEEVQKEDKYKSVQSLDGLVLVTQHDIPWREDIFDGFHFYDISQCMEFINNGKKVVVPYQEQPWFLHDCGIANLNNYEKYRNIFLDEYSKKLFPLVSILIPTYNRLELFKQALESAVNQTYRNVEIIVGDDSTNENTKDFMRNYSDRYKDVKYIYNGGPLGNYGLNNDINIFNLSKGEYFNFLMDDDLFSSKEKIEKMMNFYIQYEGVSLVTSFRDAIDINGNNLNEVIGHKPLTEQNMIYSGDTVGRELLKIGSNFIGEPTTVLVKKSYVTGFFGNYLSTQYLQMSDMAQWLECCRFGDVVYISEPLSSFRVHNGQKQADKEVIIRCYNEEFDYICDSLDDGYFINRVDDEGEVIRKWYDKAKKIFESNLKKDEAYDEFCIKIKQAERILKIEEI